MSFLSVVCTSAQYLTAFLSKINSLYEVFIGISSIKLIYLKKIEDKAAKDNGLYSCFEKMKKKRSNSRAADLKKRPSIGSPKKIPLSAKEDLISIKQISKASTVNAKYEKSSRYEQMSNITTTSTNDRPNILEKYNKINEKMDKKNFFKNEKNKSSDFLSSMTVGSNLFEQFLIFGASNSDISRFEGQHQENNKQTTFRYVNLTNIIIFCIGFFIKKIIIVHFRQCFTSILQEFL
jgi:hypothetical protein